MTLIRTNTKFLDNVIYLCALDKTNRYYLSANCLMSFIDYSAIKATDSGPVTFYIYQEVFLRGNLDDLLIINKAVKSIGKVRNRVLLAFITIPLIMTDND